MTQPPLDATNTPFSLSLLTSTKHNASKKLIADHNGRPVSDPAHKLGIAAGTMEHVQLAGLAELRDFLPGLTTMQALVHGVHKGSAPRELCQLVTLAQLATLTRNGTPRPSGSVTRSLEDIDYPDGARLIMLDVDPYPGIVTPQSAAELLQQFTGIWPVFAEVGWLRTFSTRSAIKDKATDEWLKRPEGFHVYLLVTGDVARFQDLARVKLWLAGTGYCKLASANSYTGVSAVLERCVIDLSVFSPERLDYVAGAIIDKRAPFYQDRPPGELHPGAVLDLDALPDVTDEERQQVAALVHAERLRVKPEREAQVRAHIAQASPTLDAAAVTLEMTARLERTDHGFLTPDHPLVFDGGRKVMTAGTVTAALEGKRLADPFEPDYGPSHAVFHWRGGHWLINSFAHGLMKTFRLEPTPPEPDEDDLQDLLTHAPALDSVNESTPADRAGPYHATRKGLVWMKESRYGPVAVPLTNFTARIVAYVVQDDGVDTHTSLELEAYHEGHTVRFPVEVNHFTGMTWTIEHLGARAAVYPGNLLKDHARMAVQEFSQQCLTRTIYTHLGWRKIDGSWCYLHAAGARGSDGPVPGVEVNARHTLAAYLLPGLTTLEEQRTALCASLKLLTTADDAVTIPLYAAIWRAVLGQADFSLHLVGPTGAGKSELAALAQQHYGAGMTARHLPAAWTSTGNALEALAFEAKDVLLVVDDFCPSGSTSDIARFHKDADRLLRAQGNHSGRQRLNRDSTLRAVKPPRGLILSTGEDTPQGQSLRARILILDVAPDSVQWDTLTPCQHDAADGTYATALAGFVQWLAPHYENVSQGLQDEITALRQAVLTTGHRRTPELVGNLALGMQYLLAYGYDIGALTEKECAALLERTWTALVKAAEAQSEHQTNEEPVRRFLALLTGALAAGLAHVADASTLDAPLTQPAQWGWRGHEYRRGEDVVMSWQPQGHCVGWLANERLYLEPEAAFSVGQKLAEGQKAPLPITQQTLWKRMHEKGLLIRLDTKRGNRVERKVGGKDRYVVDISAALISQNVADVADVAGIDRNPSNNKGKPPATFPKWYVKCCGMAEVFVAESSGTAPSHKTFTHSSATNAFDNPQHSQSNVADCEGAQHQQKQGAFQTNNGNPQHPQHPQQIPAIETNTFFDDARTVIQQHCDRCGEVTSHTWQQEVLVCSWCSTVPDGKVFTQPPGREVYKV